jgi:hypothetical protein
MELYHEGSWALVMLNEFLPKVTHKVSMSITDTADM